MTRMRPLACSALSLLLVLFAISAWPGPAFAQDPLPDPQPQPSDPQPQPDPHADDTDTINGTDREAVQREIDTLRAVVKRLRDAGADERRIHELETVIATLQAALDSGGDQSTDPQPAVPEAAADPLQPREQRMRELEKEIEALRAELAKAVDADNAEAMEEVHSRIAAAMAELDHLRTTTEAMRNKIAELDAATRDGDWDRVRKLASELRRMDRNHQRRNWGQAGNEMQLFGNANFDRMIEDLERQIERAAQDGQQELADALAARLAALQAAREEAQRRQEQMEQRLEELRQRADRQWRERNQDNGGSRSLRFTTTRGGVRYAVTSTYDAATGEVQITVEVTTPNGRKEVMVFDSVDEMKKNIPALRDIHLDPANSVLRMGGSAWNPEQAEQQRRERAQRQAEMLQRALDQLIPRLREADAAGDAESAARLQEMVDELNSRLEALKRATEPESQPGQHGRPQVNPDEMRADLQAQLDAMNTELESANAAGDEQRAREIGNRIAELHDALRELDRQAAERAKADRERRKAELGNELARLQEEIERLGTEWQQAKEQNDDAAMKRLEDAIANAYQHLEQLHQEIDRLEREGR